jgi:hypothetical protein
MIQATTDQKMTRIHVTVGGNSKVYFKNMSKVKVQLEQLCFGREQALIAGLLGEFLLHKTCYSNHSLTLTLCWSEFRKDAR